jgi:non-specific protein-tyrosine kinase
MSLIKKALEKARKERKLFLGEDRGYREGIGDSHRNRAKVENGAALHVLEVPAPTYSDTKSVRVDPAKLIDRKVFSILEKDEVADQYKLLRTMVLNRTRPMGHNTIEITSFKHGDGKSLTCVNLAIALAKESRQNVLLVDMDLRRPSIHSILGIDPKPGLKEYFLNNIPLKDILIHPGIERLTVLPAGGRMDNSTEIIGSYRMENLFKQLKNRYQDRYIIFDAPALVTCSDPLILSSHVDAILLVARANHTTTEDITSGMALLKDKNVLGTVFNDSEIRRGWTY